MSDENVFPTPKTIDEFILLLDGWVGCNPDRVLVLLHESDMKEGDDQGPTDTREVEVDKKGTKLHLPDHLATSVEIREIDEHARDGRPAIYVGKNLRSWIEKRDRIFLEPDALKFAPLTTFPLSDGWCFVALHGASINFVVNPDLLTELIEREQINDE